MPVQLEENYYSSAALAHKPLDPMDPACGRIILLGYVRESGNAVQIHINRDTPTCADSAATIERFSMPANIKTSAAWATQPRDNDTPVVFNAGLILWVVDETERKDREVPYLALTRSSAGAAFNFVQKRCSEEPATGVRHAFHDGMILVRDAQAIVLSEGATNDRNDWRGLKQEQVGNNRQALIASGIDAEAVVREEPVRVRAVSHYGKALPEDRDILKNVSFEVASTKTTFPAFVRWGDVDGGNVPNIFRIATLSVRRPAGKAVREMVKGADGKGNGAHFGVFTPEQAVGENVAAPVKAYLQQRGSWPAARR